MPDAIEFEFECSLANGLHVRPASHLSEIAIRFSSSIRLTNLRTGSGADLKSVLATVAADVRPGDRCSVMVDGADQALAGAELRRFIDQDLPACDGPLVAQAPKQERKLPRVLAASGANCHFGVAASRGAGEGEIVLIGSALPDFDFGQSSGAGIERAQIAQGLASLGRRIDDLLTRHPSAVERSILEAQLAILNDANLQREIDQRIESGLTAGRAAAETSAYFTQLLEQSGSSVIRERAADVQELCAELLREIYGAQIPPTHADLSGPSIVVAETLAPQQLLGLNRDRLKGIVLETSGATSHAVILARSFGVPAVAGVVNARKVLVAGDRAVVDGGRGIVISPATPAVERFYAMEEMAERRRQAGLTEAHAGPAVTRDGLTIAVGANILHPDELAPAFRNGADGIGLLRTEILFAERRLPPSEDEQYAVYLRAVREAAGRPVILRTFDTGADKPLPYLPLASERNPFLGVRGIRVYAGHRSLLMTQLRAGLRASHDGPLWLMAPMISSVEEARWFREQVETARQELGFADTVRVGAMIEVPSAAFLLPHLAEELDFFSLGTNDLSQYFFAADRENPSLAEIANVRSPAFVALLAQIAGELKKRQKWIGMCGEMAGDPRNLPLLAGLGLDEISVPVNEIGAFKKRIANLSAADCRGLVEQVLRCGTAQEVERLLEDRIFIDSAKPLLEPALVELDSEAANKEEAISELVNLLYAAGYTDDRAALEEALWARESVYPTGVGHGFAIPHCKAKATFADAIAILKLRGPIDWGSLDQQPVRVVVLFAVRESSDQGFQMKIFSQLARKLMDENFRELFLTASSAEEITRQLSRELALS